MPHEYRFSGKTALVTGSTSGIGHATAKGLAESGADVVVNGGNQGKVDAAVAAEGVEAFVKDLARQGGQSVDEAASEFVKQFRPTSLLQRFATVEEIANIVLYVSSKESSATNGAALRAEGGIVQTIV
jgi:NAD(P)-dependent dehydrogenase (short-subunit alcohol dehydrogenase family)